MIKSAISFDLDGLTELLNLFKSPDKIENEIFDESLTNILSILNQSNTKATFFIVGKYIKKYKDIFRNILDQGHEIANHTYSHNHNLKDIPIKEKRGEITQTHNLIKTKIGVESVGFRAPRYQLDKDILSLLEELNYIYDSSLIPSYHPNRLPFKWLFAPNKPYFPSKEKIWKSNTNNNKNFKILEIPTSTSHLFHIPIGGTYILNIGLWWLKYNTYLFKLVNHPITTNYHTRDGINKIPYYKNFPKYIYKNKDKSLSYIKETISFLSKHSKLTTLSELALIYKNKK